MIYEAEQFAARERKKPRPVSNTLSEYMKLKLCGVNCLDEFLLLLEDIEKWLWNNGVKQWEPGSHRKRFSEMQKMIDSGGIIVATHRTKLIGGCILTSQSPDIWNDDSKSAVYLNSLIVAREFAGSGLSRQIVQFAIKTASELGVNELRLDCWEGNDFLKKFYSDCGFSKLTPRKEHDYLVRPFKILVNT